MLLSKSCEYGLRAAIYLTSLQQDGYVSVRELGNALDISPHFLTKIFQKMTHAGLMRSFRGPNGGVALARPAGKITLRELVVAIDGPELFTECILGLPGCGQRTPCPLHESWTAVRMEMETMFGSETLEVFAEKIKGLNLRISPLRF